MESVDWNTKACPKCKNMFPNRCFQQHLQICLFGVVTCRFCGKYVKLENEKNHLNNCPRVIADGSSRFPNRTGAQNKGAEPKNQVKLEPEPENFNCIKCSVCEAYVPVKDIENHCRSHESKKCCHNKMDEQKGIEEKEDLTKRDGTTGEVAEKCPKLTDGQECIAEKDDSMKDSTIDDATETCSKLTGVDKLLEDLQNLLSTEEDSDVSIMVKDSLFKVHKNILRIRSSVFNSMFKHDMAEKSSGAVEIDDCDPEAFKKFLHYLYTGRVEDLSNEIVLNLYFVADKYDAEEVKENCIEFMKRNLCVETFCDVVALALEHSESALLETATEFFCKNIKKIIVTAQWQSFLEENTVAANELHIKALENYVIPK